jgi:hypothetical protein
LLLPHLAGVVVDTVEATSGRLRLMVRSKAVEIPCSTCSSPSLRVHSRYDRFVVRRRHSRPAGRDPAPDTPWFCPNDDCPVRTFVEQVEGLSTRYARRIAPLRRSLEQIALALAGRAGARLAARLGLPVGRSSLLCLIRALPDPPADEVTVVGIDDFAVIRALKVERFFQRSSPPWASSTRSSNASIVTPHWEPGDLPVGRRVRAGNRRGHP